LILQRLRHKTEQVAEPNFEQNKKDKKIILVQYHDTGDPFV
jgi:hypothetical protein